METLVSSETAGPTSARERVKPQRSPARPKRRRLGGERRIEPPGQGRSFRGAGPACGRGPPRCSIFRRASALGDSVRPCLSRSVVWFRGTQDGDAAETERYPTVGQSSRRSERSRGVSGPDAVAGSHVW